MKRNALFLEAMKSSVVYLTNMYTLPRTLKWPLTTRYKGYPPPLFLIAMQTVQKLASGAGALMFGTECLGAHVADAYSLLRVGYRFLPD